MIWFLVVDGELLGLSWAPSPYEGQVSGHLSATRAEGVSDLVAIVQLVSEASELCVFSQNQCSKTWAARVAATRVCTGAFASFRNRCGGSCSV